MNDHPPSRPSAWEIEAPVGLLEADETKMIANGAMKRVTYRTKAE